MPPLRPSRCLLAGFTEKPIISCSQLLLTKKPVDFDYVAVDASGLVGGALRLSKSVSSEQRRHKEVGRHVVQGVQQILKRINCRTSLLIALDGAESLAKAAATRTAPLTRRLESRLARLPGTALMQAVEERLLRMMPGRQFLPREVVIAGTGVAGCVEEKMTAWALDLACRANFNGGSGQSLALVGPQELYMNTLALTPYYNACSLVQGQGADLRQMTLTHLLEWLGLEELAVSGSSEAVARARTDVVFLLLLCSGGSAAELAPVTHLRFATLFAVYRETVLQLATGPERHGTSASASATSPSRAAAGDGVGQFLFTDAPGNRVELNLEALAALLAWSVPAGGAEPKEDARAESYLELALQAHASLCLGYTPDPLYVPPTFSPSLQIGGSGGAGAVPASAQVVTASQLYGHVLYLIASACKRIGVPEADAASTNVVVTAPHHHHHHRRARDVTDSVAPSKKASALKEGNEESGGDTAEAHESGRSKTESVQGQAYSPFFSPTQPLTAAEFTVLSHSTTPGVEAVFHLCMNSGSSVAGQAPQYVQPLPELLKRITAADTHGALGLVRQALSFASADRPHHTVCLSPSYYWAQNARTRLWRMAYVDLGQRSAHMGIRRLRNAMSGVNVVLQTSEDGPAVFDAERGRWTTLSQFPFQEPTSSPTAQAQPEDPIAAEKRHSTLKVLTWNVMFDRYSGQPTPLGMPGIDWCSPKRYPVLAKLIEAEDADVVAMQEVEAPFLRFLTDQPWCRERYILSCTPESAVVSPWGVAMLVRRRRFPVTAVTHVNIPAWSGHISLMPIVTLAMPHGPVHVAAVHLLAPFTKNHESVRTEQDQALRTKLTRGISGAEDCVAMGDFNDWPANEFVMPAETQYRECWPLVHPRDKGSTMDETNTFCKLKIEEIFFGRSDKVFLRSQRLRPVSAHLVGTRSVNDENGNTEAPAYLFPSDHYGVSVTLSL